MPDEASGSMIELRAAGNDGSDVIETGGIGARATLNRIGTAVRRRPLAIGVSIVAVAVLIVAGTQIVGRSQEKRAAAAAPSPSASASPTAPATLTASPAAPSPTASPTGTVIRLDTVERPPLDTVVADELRTKNGQRLSLAWAGQSPYPTAVPGGWLVQGPGTLWFLRSDGATSPLLWQIESVVIGPRGDRVAWRKDGRVMLARLVNGALTGTRESDAKQYVPMWFLGDAVVMGLYSGEGPRPDTFDLWRPALGAFQPRARQTSAFVFGPNGDGTALLGVEATTDNKGCLVELNVETLKVTSRACVLPVAGQGPHTIAPGGRWLILNLNQGDPKGQLFRVDLKSAFTKPTPATVWSADLDLIGAWADESTFIGAGRGVLKRITMARPDQTFEIPLTEVPEANGGGPIYIVPVLRAVP